MEKFNVRNRLRVPTIKMLLLLAVSATLVSSAHAGVFLSNTSWEWGNELPQGYDLNGIQFGAGQGYAIGASGTLLVTSDGSTWTGLASGTSNNLTELDLIDADSLVVAGGCTARRSDDGGSTFTRLPWTVSDSECDSKIVALNFASESVGYLILENGSVLLTEDRGETWSIKTAIPSSSQVGGSSQPTDVEFLNSNLGFVTSMSGKIYKTTDQGSSWTDAKTTSDALLDLTFLDSSTGYAASAGAVVKTSDGGATWETVNSSLSDVTSINCFTAVVCTAAVSKGTSVYVTTDGWAAVSSVAPSTSKIVAVAPFTSTRLVAVGARGTTVVSSDAGVNWQSISSGVEGDYVGVVAASGSTAYAYGFGGKLARTINGGASWENISAPTNKTIVAVSFSSQDSGYVLTTGSKLYATANGGKSWKSLDPGTEADIKDLLALNGNVVLTVLSNGVFRSVDGGTSFEPVSAGALRKLSLFSVDGTVAGSKVLAIGSKGVAISADKGSSWKKISLKGIAKQRGIKVGQLRLSGADFATGKVGYVTDAVGLLWKTKNGGKSWERLNSTGAYVADVVMTSATKGFAGIPSSNATITVARTTNGGKTWELQPVTSDAELLAIYGAPGRDYLLFGGNDFLSSTKGGVIGTSTSLSISSRASVKAGQKVKVTGKLGKAQGGETVVVSMIGASSSNWDSRSVEVSSSGTFTTTWTVSKKSYFVAQFAGNGRLAGASTKPITVKVKKK